jgi:hypothetical protein
MTRKLFILVILLLVSVPVSEILSEAEVFAQVDTAWVRRYNGPGNSGDGASAIAVDASGNVYVTGYSGGSGTGTDYATIKYYPNGDTAWVRRYNGPGNSGDGARAIAVDGSGNVYVTGQSGGNGTAYDYATIKYDTWGNELWVRRYTGPGNYSDKAYAIAVDNSGNVCVTGLGVGGEHYGELDCVTIKYDPAGNELWVRQYTGSWYSAYGVAIALDDADNVYVTGHTCCILVDSIGEWEYFTTKYSPGGTRLWLQIYDNGYGQDYSEAIAVDDSGNVYVTGTSKGSAGNGDYATIKYDTHGNELWVRRYNGTGNDGDIAHAIATDGAGNVYVTGISHGGWTGFGYATIKYDASGNEMWIRRYNGPGNSYYDEASAIAVDGSGNVYVTGRSDSTGTEQNYDYATIKYDEDGDELWVRRYNGPGNRNDQASAIAIDGSGNVYVTGWGPGSGTSDDYATIKYSPICPIVGNMSICAKSISNLGGGNYKAQDSVWIGDETGENYYLYLGDTAEVTFNVEAGTVSNVVLGGNVHLSAKAEDYDVDAIASLTIDALAGAVNFAGTVHYSDSAIFQNSFSGACTLALNQHEIYGRVEFSDPYFGTIGVHAGSWKLDSCAFFGIHNDINVTVPIGFTDLTVIDGQVTLGVFPNTGIFRVGLTNGAMEFKESGGAFGFDLTGFLAPPGVPSQGMIDVDLAHLRVNVVKDIPIGLWEYPKNDSSGANPSKLNSKTLRTDWSSLRKIDQSTYIVDVYDKEGNKYQIALVDVGLTIKGEESYTDLDCDGYHDPDEPFEDEDGDGLWDEGTNFSLSNNTFNGHGHVTLDLSLVSYIHFTGEDAVVDVAYPEHHRIDTQVWYGLRLGNIFEVTELATGYLHLDYENQRYWGGVTLRHPEFQDLVVVLDSILIAFNPFEFRGEIGADFNIEGVQFLTADFVLHVDERGFYTTSYIDAYGLLHAEGIFFIRERKVAGSFLGDFHIADLHLVQLNNRFYFAPNQCMSGSGSAKLCVWKLCRGVPFSYRICSAANWWVNIGGLSISLGSPAKLHIYDSQGRHTGINAQGGIETGIPGSEFYVFEDVGQQLAFLPDPDLVGGYTIDVEGLADSVFDLDILYPNKTDGNAYNVGYFEEPTQIGGLHRVNLNVSNTWTMQNDLDGDSVFESQTQPDSTAQATLDTAMVTITNVASEIVCANEAKITWKTNVPATSEVLYRSEHDSVYESVSDTTLTTSHSVIVDNILTTDTCYYIPVSVDTSGNIASFLEKSFKLEFVVGDANRDGVIDISDVVYLINYLFIQGPAPVPLEAGDATCDGVVDASDIVYLLNYLFVNGPPPCR